MKKSFLSTLMAGLAVVAFTFSSCTTDPCKDVSCGANGECVEGDCVCDEGYEGTTCDTEMRAKFAGTWTLDESCPSGSVNGIAVTIADGATISEIGINGFGGFQCSGSNIIVKATVNGRDLTIAQQTFCGGNVIINSGTGSINASGNAITITYNYSIGGASESCTGTYAK